MKAVVYQTNGSAEVLTCKEIERPTALLICLRGQ